MSIMRNAVRAASGRIEQLPDGGWSRHFCFANDSAVFSGHFPGRPVLPAVVQILLAQITLEDCLPAFVLARVPQAKFFMPVGPHTDIVLHISPGRKPFLWVCVLSCGEAVAARFQLEGDVYEAASSSCPS